MNPSDNFKKYNEVKKMYRIKQEYEDDLRNGFLSNPDFTSRVIVTAHYKFVRGWISKGKDMRVLERVVFKYLVANESLFIMKENELTIGEIETLEKCGLIFQINSDYLGVMRMKSLQGLGT